jgi:hypothetical protein
MNILKVNINWFEVDLTREELDNRLSKYNANYYVKSTREDREE